MVYVIGAACTDVLDRGCMDECPTDAIYAGVRRFYINPAECMSCGNCALVCPVQAIRPAKGLPTSWHPYRDAARDLFADLGATGGGSMHTEPLPDPPELDALPEASTR